MFIKFLSKILAFIMAPFPGTMNSLLEYMEIKAQNFMIKSLEKILEQNPDITLEEFNNNPNTIHAYEEIEKTGMDRKQFEQIVASEFYLAQHRKRHAEQDND